MGPAGLSITWAPYPGGVFSLAGGGMLSDVAASPLVGLVCSSCPSLGGSYGGSGGGGADLDLAKADLTRRLARRDDSASRLLSFRRRQTNRPMKKQARTMTSTMPAILKGVRPLLARVLLCLGTMTGIVCLFDIGGS